MYCFITCMMVLHSMIFNGLFFFFFFRATFVKSLKTFWVDVRSSALTYTGTTSATVSFTFSTPTWNLRICRSVLVCCFIFSRNCSVHFRFHQILIVGQPKSASVSPATVTQLPAQAVTSWQFRHHLTNQNWRLKCLARLMDISPLGFQMTSKWYTLCPAHEISAGPNGIWRSFLLYLSKNI